MIGRPAPEWGHDVVAFVVPRNGTVDPAALDAHYLERFKRLNVGAGLEYHVRAHLA